MPETVTLTLPDSVLQPVKRSAEAVHRPIEELLLTALQSSLPPLEGLPDEAIADLTGLETLGNDSLLLVMTETLPAETQAALSKLLERHEDDSLTSAEEERLASLQGEADLVMLRKARAAVLLRFRGKRLPTLAELDQLTESNDARLEFIRCSVPSNMIPHEVAERIRRKYLPKRSAAQAGPRLVKDVKLAEPVEAPQEAAAPEAAPEPKE